MTEIDWGTLAYDQCCWWYSIPHSYT